jgi:hypothetical protein
LINLSPNHYRSLENVPYQSNTNGPRTKEAFIFNDMSVHIFKMKILTLGLLKQFEYESLLVHFEAKGKQNAEFYYCRGRLVYTKSLIFGYMSSFGAFNLSNPKSLSSYYSPTFFKSSVWQLIDHGVLTLVIGAHPHLKNDNSIGSNHPSGWASGLKLEATEDGYNKPFYYFNYHNNA